MSIPIPDLPSSLAAKSVLPVPHIGSKTILRLSVVASIRRRKTSLGIWLT